MVWIQPLRVSRSGWAHWTGGSCRWERTQLACSGGDRVRDGTGDHVFVFRSGLALDGRVLLHLPRRDVVRCVVQDVTVAGSTPHWCERRMGCRSGTG